MPVTVNHVLTATTPDDPAYEIRPSHWNSVHVAALSATAGTEIYGAFSNDPAYNVTFTTNGGGQVVASANVTAAPSPVNVTGANGSSVNAQTIAFSNSNGLTLGVSTAVNGATVTGSYTVPTVPTSYVSQVNGSSGAISFATGSSLSSSSNGSTITWGLASNITTALQSAGAYLTTARASNDAIGLNTAQSNVTWTANSAGLSLDARGYAGTATAVTGAASLTVNSGGVSFNGSSLAGVGTTFNGANISGSMTVNTAGVNLSMSVAAPGGGANFSAGVSTGGNTSGDTGVTGTRLVFAGGNNITLSQGTDANGATVTISGANAGGAQTGISGLQVSNTTYTSGTVTFQNANGISFGSSGANGISASYTVPSTAGLISAINVSAGTTSNNLSALTFSNANGLSFGLNASTITASYTVPTQTNQTLGGYFVGNTTGQSSSSTVDARTISVDGAGIVSAGWSAGSIRISATQSNQALSGSNGSFTFQTATWGNLNGLSFYTSNGSMVGSHNALTTARASTDAIGLNTAQTNVTWTVNSSGLSLNAAGYAGTATTFNGTNASGSMTLNSAGLRLDLSVAAGGGATPVASASNGSFSFTTLGFSNANNVTFGTSAGSIITASVAAPGAAAENNWVNLLGANTAGNTTASGSTIGYSGINLTLSGTNGSVVNISAPATSSLSATGMLSISTNGSTISMGVGRTISGLVLAPFGGLGGPVPFAQSSISLGQNSLYMYPVQIEDYLTCDHFRIPVMMTNSSSAAASVQKGLTYQVGVYTRHSTNSTLLSRHYSSSYTMAASHNSNASWMLSMITGIGNSTSYNTLTASSAGLNLSASLHGPRELIVPVSSLFTPGEYVMAMLVSSSSAGAGGAVLNNSNMAVAYQTFNQVGASTNATGTGFYKFMNMGTYSATTGALPASISATQINQLGTMPIMFAAMGTV